MMPFFESTQIDTICYHIIKKVKPNQLIKQKIDTINKICSPLTIEQVINEKNRENTPIWYFLIREGHKDIFNLYSEKVPKNIGNISLYLSIENSLRLNMEWFDEKKFEEAFIIYPLDISPSNIQYAIDNKLFKNFSKSVVKITNRMPEIITILSNLRQSNFPAVANPETINLIYNHYYDLTNNKKTLIKIFDYLTKYQLFDGDGYKALEIFTGEFKKQLVELIISTGQINEKYIQSKSTILLEAIDNDDFKQYKKIIYEAVKGSEILPYAILKGYFTKDDLVEYSNHQDIKSRIQQIILDESLTQPKQKNRIKM